MRNGLPDNVFRANVGAMIINDKGEVLALERSDVPGAWQMPQGGLKEGEAPEHAVLREVAEETNINKNKLEIIAEYPDWLAYELDKSMRTDKLGRGQVQKWFLLRFTGDDADIDVEAVSAEHHEFRAWRWIRFQELISIVSDFRKPVYKRLFTEFNRLLKT